MELLSCSNDIGACTLFNWIFSITMYLYVASLVGFIAIKLINRS